MPMAASSEVLPDDTIDTEESDKSLYRAIKLDEWVLNFRDILEDEFDYTDDGTYPPFTPSQLLAMATLSHPKKKMKPSSVRKILPRVFKYFDDRVSRAAINDLRFPEMRRLIRTLHNPIQLKKDKLTILSGFEYEALHPESRDRRFPFLRLPTELRLLVYELALRYDTSKHGLRVHSRICIYNLPGARAFEANINGQYVSRILPYELLALLSVNKQVHEEAKEIFYRDNFFRFDSLRDLSLFLSGIGRERRGYLRRVAFCWDRFEKLPQDVAHANRVLELLSDVQNLRFLHVQLDWLAISHDSEKDVKSPENIAGLCILRKFRGLEKEVSFGDKSYDEVKEYLRKEMMKPKAGCCNECAPLKRIPL